MLTGNVLHPTFNHISFQTSYDPLTINIQPHFIGFCYFVSNLEQPNTFPNSHSDLITQLSFLLSRLNLTQPLYYRSHSINGRGS